MSVFFTSRKTGFKSWLNTSSIPPRHLVVCRDSSAVSYRFLTASRYLVDRSRKLLPPRLLLDTWWIDRAFALGFDELFLDTSAIDDLFLIPPSIASLIPLDTCIYRALLRVYIFISLRSDSHFFNLSQSVHICSSPKHHLSYSKPLPLCFFKLFQVFSSLGKFLISHSSCISCFET